MIGLLDELEIEVEAVVLAGRPDARGATSPGGHLAPPETPAIRAVRAVPPPAEPAADPLAHAAAALIKACEAELAGDPSTPRAARLHYEVARLYESPLRDLRRASAHYQEAHGRAPEHLPTIRGARRVLIARKAYQQALPLFDAEVRVTSEPSRKAALHYAKGRLLEDVMGLRDEARKAYATALELDRSDATILKAVEQCEVAAEAWDALARTYEREANAVSADPRHRAALIVERARLIEERRGDVDAAIELYETSLRLDAEQHAALAALKRLHHGQRRWRDLIRVLEQEAAQTTDPVVRTMALYRIGRLHTERLGNEAEALSALERAAEVSPDDPLVLEELARLYEATERWGRLVETLQRLVATLPEPAERLGMLARVGALCDERLEDSDAAVRWYEAALGVQPTYVPALQALGKLYQERGAWEALIRMLVAEAEGTEDAKRRAAAYARVADTLETALERADDAVDFHKRALAQVPGYPPSFKALCRLLSRAGRFRELVELYERAVDQAPGKERAVPYLMKIGSIYEDHLEEPAQAAHTYRRILNMSPDDLGAIHALQRATEQAGRDQELVEALELEAEKVRDEAQIVALLHRAGEVLDDRLGDRDGALIRFRKVLGIDPTYVPALISLGRIYYRAGRWEDLLDMYKRELELTPRGPQSVALLLKMGELCEERIGRDEEAVALYRRAIDVDATHAPALRALARKLRERSEWPELVKILEVELTGLSDPKAKARTAFRIGEVYEERLQQHDRAIAAYEQAVKINSAYRPATDALARLRADRKAWGKLVEDLTREASSTPDAGLAVSALVRQGRIWADSLDDPRRAIACFEEVLAREPGHVGGLLALETLYRRVGAWDHLGRIYDLQARTFADLGAKVCALRELARLQETRSGAVGGDVQQTHLAILRLSEGDALALEALERLALERLDRRLLGEVDGHLARQSEDTGVQAAYLTRLAESLEAAGQTADSLETYRAALDADPENLGATRGLTRIAEEMGDPVALAEAARREAAVASDGAVAARLLVRSATVRAERLGDLAGAVADLERALELHPDHAEGAERLTELLTADKHFDRLADLLARAAASATAPDRVAALWMSVAAIQADRLENLPGAIGSLNRVLRTAPNHVATLRRLAGLYQKDGQWTEAVHLLSRVVQLAPDREVLRDAHLELAAIWDERLEETSRALVSLQAVLALDPENFEALARLSDLQERDGKTEQAVETAERLVSTSRDPDARAAALLRLARLERKLGNGPACFKALLEAVALEGPGSESALELKATMRSTAEWEHYAQALSRHLDACRKRGDDTAPTYLELARVRQDQMGQPQAAIDLLAKGLGESREPTKLRLDLTARLRTAGKHKDAIDQLRVLLDEDLTRAETWRELARNWDAMRREGETRLTVMPLVILGAATRAERQHLERHPPRPVAASEGSMASDVVAALLPRGKAESAAEELLRGLGPGLAKLYPSDLEAFGLSARDRITSRQGHALRGVAERIAAVVGLGELELYVHRMRNRGVAVELGSPPTLLVPAWVAELTEAQQVFVLARPIVAMSMRLHVMEKLTPRELEVLLASAARMVSPGYGAGLTSEDILEDQSKRLAKALPRKTRKEVMELARAYVEASRVDFARWSDDVLRGFRRVSAVLADDLVACVDVLCRTERDLAGLAGAELVRGSPMVRDLMRFWISETALNLRKRSGLVPA